MASEDSAITVIINIYRRGLFALKKSETILRGLDDCARKEKKRKKYRKLKKDSSQNRGKIHDDFFFFCLKIVKRIIPLLQNLSE